MTIRRDAPLRLHGFFVALAEDAAGAAEELEDDAGVDEVAESSDPDLLLTKDAIAGPGKV